jgi:hypothetical protein
MAVTVPLVSAVNETPSSTGPLDPLSTVAGTLVFDQMVCWAAKLAAQANTRPRPKDISAPTCLKKFVIDALTAAFPAR